MSLCILSERCKKIVGVLLRENKFISMKNIAEITESLKEASIMIYVILMSGWMNGELKN